MFAYACGKLLHLFGWQCLLVVEVHVSLSGDGEKMDVRMRHFKPYHRYTDALARHCFLQSESHALGKELQACVFLVSEVKM